MAGKVYTVAQVKGGSGKTTMALSLAALLKEMKRDPLVLDSDSTNSHISHHLRKRVEFIRSHPELGLDQIPFEFHRDYQGMAKSAVKATERNSSVVIDCSPAREASTIAAMGLADVIVVPVRQGHLDIEVLERMEPVLDVVYSQRIRLGDKPKVFSILTDFRPTKLGRQLSDALLEWKGVQFLGTVPHSELLGASLFDGVAFWEAYPDRMLAKEFKSNLQVCLGR